MGARPDKPMDGSRQRKRQTDRQTDRQVGGQVSGGRTMDGWKGVDSIISHLA